MNTTIYIEALDQEVTLTPEQLVRELELQEEIKAAQAEYLKRLIESEDQS